MENEVYFLYTLVKRRGEHVKVDIKIDTECTETKVVILTSKITEEINELVKKLSEDSPQIIVGMKEDKLEILEQSDIIRIYSSDKKVFAVTNRGQFVVRLRLYEIEERLDTNKFVRIAHSEIINIKKVKHFDLNFTGTICVSLNDGTMTYVSRRYVSKIKLLLGL